VARNLYEEAGQALAADALIVIAERDVQDSGAS